MNKKITNAFRCIFATLLLFQTSLARVLAQTDYIDPVDLGGGWIILLHRVTNIVVGIQLILSLVLLVISIGMFFFGKDSGMKGVKDDNIGRFFKSGILLGVSSFIEINLLNFLFITIIIENPSWWDNLLRQGYPTFVIVYAIILITTVILVKIWRKKKSDFSF